MDDNTVLDNKRSFDQRLVGRGHGRRNVQVSFHKGRGKVIQYMLQVGTLLYQNFRCYWCTKMVHYAESFREANKTGDKKRMKITTN